MNASIALMIYGDSGSTRNAISDDKYQLLATALSEAVFGVESVLYNDSKANELPEQLSRFQAVLVWVNPIEQGHDRRKLDAMLLKLADKPCLVSAHPEVILKIGTKQVLYDTKNMDWSLDTELYGSFNDFHDRFLISLERTPVRILKHYRGNGGNGVFKVWLNKPGGEKVHLLHALKTAEEKILTRKGFFEEFQQYFERNGVLLNQQWNPHIINGMVRCYLTGTRVSGFGYQEANALCPKTQESESGIRPTSKRFYFSEACGLFQDLRNIMELKWVPQLQEIHAIPDDKMPLLWDADFFINHVNSAEPAKKYSLCEINASCVSPFPESCIAFVVNELKRRFPK